HVVIGCPLLLSLLLVLGRPPCSPLFPYTTLFRSCDAGSSCRAGWACGVGVGVADPGKPTDTPYGENPGGDGDPGGQRQLDGDAEIGRAPSELQSRFDLVCRLLLEKKKRQIS